MILTLRRFFPGKVLNFPLLRQLTWREGLFSIKSFIAAMTALYIAFKLNLDQPVWAVTTVYVVSQQFAGMVLAKSFYRVLGTYIGAAASLFFVALFSNSPELFCLALALWMGLGTTVTLYLRDAPAAYVGMLSGYSAAIIGLPAALAPDTAFDFAVARCLEITLGIGCATLVHHVVFPKRAGVALKTALRMTLPSFARWGGDALRGEQSEATGLADRKRILADVVTLDHLRQFAVLDTQSLRAIDPTLRQFEGELFSLLSLLMSVYDRFALLLKSQPAMAEQLRPLLERSAELMANTANDESAVNPGHEADGEAALRQEIARRLPTLADLRADVSSFLVRAVLLRLADMLVLWRDALRTRAAIMAGQPVNNAGAAPAFKSYRDLTGALLGGLITTVTVLAASAFWIVSAWPSGPLAVTFAGIICAIVAARDDAVAASASFLKMSFVGTAIAFVYLFAILPPVVTFEQLVFVLAPLYLTCGLLLGIPALIPLVIPVIFVAGGLMALTNAMTYDFAAFCNNALSFNVGIAIGMAGLNLLSPLRTGVPVRRLVRGMLRDLASLTTGRLTDQTAFESRMFDRINTLFARLNPMVSDERETIQGGLGGLRLGLNVLALRALRPDMTSEMAALTREMLGQLVVYFTDTANGRTVDAPADLFEAASRQILEFGEGQVTLRTAEYLYNISILLRQHATAFTPHAPVQMPPPGHPVPA